MVKRLPKIENGIKSEVFITSDHAQFDVLEDAKWHEFHSCKLDARILSLQFPTNNCLMTFYEKADMKRFISEEYAGKNVIIAAGIDNLTFPNKYVLVEIEDEMIPEDYLLIFIELEAMKQRLIKDILAFN